MNACQYYILWTASCCSIDNNNIIITMYYELSVCGHAETRRHCVNTHDVRVQRICMYSAVENDQF